MPSLRLRPPPQTFSSPLSPRGSFSNGSSAAGSAVELAPILGIGATIFILVIIIIIYVATKSAKKASDNEDRYRERRERAYDEAVGNRDDMSHDDSSSTTSTSPRSSLDAAAGPGGGGGGGRRGNGGPIVIYSASPIAAPHGRAGRRPGLAEMRESREGNLASIMLPELHVDTAAANERRQTRGRQGPRSREGNTHDSGRPSSSSLGDGGNDVRNINNTAQDADNWWETDGLLGARTPDVVPVTPPPAVLRVAGR